MDFGLLLIIIFILAPLLEKLLAAGRKNQQQPPQVPPGRRPGQGTQRTLPRPQQRWPEPDEEETPFRSVPASHTPEDDSAAGVVPDDLWEILTGERRQPRPPQEPAGAPPADVRAETAPQGRPVPAPVDARAETAQRRERRPERSPDAPRERAARPGRPPAPMRERTRAPVDLRDRTRPPVELRDRTPRERDPEKLRPTGRPASAADAYVRPEHIRVERVVTSYDDQIVGDEERHTAFHRRIDEAAAAAAAARVDQGPQVYRFDSAADLRRAVVMAEILAPPKALQQDS